MSALVERLAEALWNAERPFWTENNPFGRSVPWLWRDADEGARDVYRRMAERVAAELGLAEEWGYSAAESTEPVGWWSVSGDFTAEESEQHARADAAAHQDGGSVFSRWVMPWLEVTS